MLTKTYKADSSVGQRILKVQALKAQIDALSEQLDAEKAHLLGVLIRNDFTSIKCEATTVSRRERACWTYSAATQDAELKLKQRKQREQLNGTAINKPTEHAVVTVSAKALNSILLAA